MWKGNRYRSVNIVRILQGLPRWTEVGSELPQLLVYSPKNTLNLRIINCEVESYGSVHIVRTLGGLPDSPEVGSQLPKLLGYIATVYRCCGKNRDR
jgi:hypothetical protein